MKLLEKVLFFIVFLYNKLESGWAGLNRRPFGPEPLLWHLVPSNHGTEYDFLPYICGRIVTSDDTSMVGHRSAKAGLVAFAERNSK